MEIADIESEAAYIIDDSRAINMLAAEINRSVPPNHEACFKSHAIIRISECQTESVNWVINALNELRKELKAGAAAE